MSLLFVRHGITSPVKTEVLNQLCSWHAVVQNKPSCGSLAGGDVSSKLDLDSVGALGSRQLSSSFSGPEEQQAATECDPPALTWGGDHAAPEPLPALPELDWRGGGEVLSAA